MLDSASGQYQRPDLLSKHNMLRVLLLCNKIYCTLDQRTADSSCSQLYARVESLSLPRLPRLIRRGESAVLDAQELRQSPGPQSSPENAIALASALCDQTYHIPLTHPDPHLAVSATQIATSATHILLVARRCLHDRTTSFASVTNPSLYVTEESSQKVAAGMNHKGYAVVRQHPKQQLLA